MCYFFQVQAIAPQGNLGDVHLLSSVHPVLPAVQTHLWGSGVDTETTAPGLDLTVAPTAPVPAPASISVQVETQAPAQTPALVAAQNQPPVPAQAVAMPQTPASTHVKDPTSVQALASAPVQAPVSASGPTFEPPKSSSTSSDATSAVDKPKLSVPGLSSAPIPITLPASVESAAAAHAPTPVAASVPAPVLQPAGIQTAASVSECSSLATTQQNLEQTSASSSLQQEPCVEVGMNPESAHFHTNGCS